MDLSTTQSIGHNQNTTMKLPNIAQQSVDSIMTKHPHTGIILTGDFNKFLDRLITSCIPSLKQLVTFPTREMS